MSSDSEDETIFGQICQLVTTNMDSVILQYPKLWGLGDLPERNPDTCDVQLINSPDDFRSQFHMSQSCFQKLINKLANTTKIRNLDKKLLFTLWMLCTIESYEAVGDRFGYSKSSGHLAFNEVLDGILSLFPEYIKWPKADDYPQISQAFKELSGGFIPGIIGVIDTCHINIREPRKKAEDYSNKRYYYSIVVQAVCDHRKIFTDVYVGAPGGLSDSDVFRRSNIYKEMDKFVPSEYHLIGGRAYPLLRNLVVPFRESSDLTEEELRFNFLLGNVMASGEHALIILKERFKKLKYIDSSSPEMAIKIVCACLVLHNHTLLHDGNEAEDELLKVADQQKEFVVEDEEWDLRREKKKAGFAKRNYLISICD